MTAHNDSVAEMSEAQAWELLSGTVFGRLAVSVDDQPKSLTASSADQSGTGTGSRISSRASGAAARRASADASSG